MMRLVSVTARAVFAAGALIAASGVFAQSSQTLDRTAVFNRTKVLDTHFNDAARLDDFSVLGITATGLTHCQLAIDNALYCLDGLVIRNWLDPESATGAGTPIASCTDTKLGLDTNKPADTCPAMTVDQTGAVWLMGKKGNSYTLIKLTPNAACDGTPLAPGGYCFKFGATSGRVADITPIDGEASTLFPLGRGTLGVQAGADLVFFAAAGTPVRVLVTGRTWNLASQETVQAATLLQLKSGTGAVRNFAVVSTSSGRALAVEISTTPPAGTVPPATLVVSAPFAVFNAVAARPASMPTPCNNTLAPQFAIRAGKSQHIYLTDRACHLAHALKVTAPPSGDPRPFVLAVDGDLTFDLTSTYPPDGVTVAPGIVVNLAECAGECTALSNGAGEAALKLSGVSLVGAADKATLFLLEDLVDCRWVPNPPAVCAGTSLPAGADPTEQYLNITPQLPSEIRVLFPSLPPLLLSPRYRALPPGFTFDAFFFKPEQGLKFNGKFAAEYFVENLTPNFHACENSNAQTIEDHRKFGVVTTISETWLTVGAPGGGLGNVAMLLNTGCGSTTTLKPGRLSLFPFNLEPTPRDGDRVLINLLTSLSDDWEATRDQLACSTRDGARPLSTTVCNSLRSAWANMDSKLEKCVQDLTTNSNTAANCNSFQIQFGSLQTTVGKLTSTTDPANRVAELQVRLSVMEDLYYRRVKPSYLP